VLLVLAIAGSVYLWRRREASTAGDAPTIASIAVLPFTNVNADPDTEFLSDGITDNIIDRLSQLSGLKVMAHTAVFRYKGREVDPRTIGTELGVEAVLNGRLTKRNDGVTINLELVSTRDNTHLWGQQYERKLSELLIVQREIPLDVSEKLRLKLSGESKERLAKQYTDNAEAYQLYLKGRLSWEKWSLEGTKKAIEYFQEAIKKDPDYALAYAGLADAFTNAPYGTGLPANEAHRRAREAATKALALDPMLGEPHAALAQILLLEDWDFAGAEREFRRAIELSPSDGEAHHLYSHLLVILGRTDESLVEAKKFLDLDPLSPAPNLHLGFHYLYARQYDLSLQQHLKTLEMDPNSPRAHDQLADTYYQKGMFDEAVAEYLKEETLIGTSAEDVTALKNAYSSSGIRGFLRRYIEQFVALRARNGDGLSLAIAGQYSRLGDKERAFQWLETGYAEHDGSLVYLRQELVFDNVRSDPRYADLLRRIGLPQ
jgi:TolB-like protein/Tfp pilus assembly protein PilF